MSNFSNNSITNNGRALLADVMAGAVFTPTRIAMGSGKLPVGTTPQNIAALVTPVKNLDITKKERTPDGKFIVGGIYSNLDITEAFYFRELALFAKAVFLNDDGSVRSEGDEVLYSYGNSGDDADLMPAYSTNTMVERMLDLVTWVGNEAAVDLTIASGIYASAADLEALRVEFRTEFQQGLSSHTSNKNNPHGVTAAQVGARPNTWMPTAAQVGAVAKTGDTMTGPLTINKGTRWGNIVIPAINGEYRCVETDENRLRFDVRVGIESANRYYLDLYDPEGRELSHALSLVKVTAGNNGQEVYDEKIVLHTGNMNLIDPSLFSGCKMETGSYIGTGTSSETGPNSITFTKGTPMLVIIQKPGGGCGIIYPQSGGGFYAAESLVRNLSSSVNGRTLVWDHYASNVYQLNEKGITYHYLAFVI